MARPLGIVRVPTRFEGLVDAVGRDNIRQVLIESAVDLTVVKESIAELASANQGKLLFLIGKTGVGKTHLLQLAVYILRDT